MSRMAANGAARHERCDPLAVAAGNASLLGIGYLLVGRRRVALGSGLITAFLVTVLAASGSATIEGLVLLWWAALVCHGWWLGRRRPGRPARARRIGVASAVVVLLAVVSLRTNAGFVAASFDDARARGDCPAAELARQRAWLGTRVADAPSAAEADDTLEACRQLQGVRDRLEKALAPDIGQLSAAYRETRQVLVSFPHNERIVDAALADFVARLTGQEGCAGADVAEWLGGQPVQDDPLGRLSDTAADLTPAALVGCGDELRSRADFAGATARYQQVLDGYPGAPQAEQARQGLAAAATGQQDLDARQRITRYCDEPFGYPPAPAVGPGINRAIIFDGSRFLSAKYLVEWAIQEPTQAVLVVCIGSRENGSAGQTCDYVWPGGEGPVTFYRAAFPVRVYELRSGRELFDSKVQIGNATCVNTIDYETFGPFLGRPYDQYAEVTGPEVSAALVRALQPFIER